MLTKEGQIHRLKMWVKDPSPKYIMLLNMEEDFSKDLTLSEVVESSSPEERSGYKRVQLAANEWSIPQAVNGSNASVVSVEKSFGPFTTDVAVTHVGLCSVEDGTDGILYLVAPLQHYITTKEPRIFGPGEVFSVSIRDEQV